MSQPIALGVSAIKYGTPGDGIPAAVLTEFPKPHLGSVVFNFSDPTEVKIETEGSMDPFYSYFVKNATDYIEFALPSPANDLLAVLMGGVVAAGVWKEPISMPDIAMTIVLETEVHNAQKVIYTIVNGKIAAKLSQAPGKDKIELLMVRVYKQAAITAAGVRGYAFSREVQNVV